MTTSLAIQHIRERVTGFLAGLTYGLNGLSYEDSYDLISDVPIQDLKDWENGHFLEHRQRVVFGTQELSVVDTFPTEDENKHIVVRDSESVFVRSMYFNRRIDLEQSRVLVSRFDENEVFNFTEPSPHVRGLAIALAAIRNNSKYPVRVCVLGGGGCVLSMFFRSMLDDKSQIDTVDISNDALFLARRFFGIAEYEGDRFRIHEQCGIAWTTNIAKTKPHSIDILAIDVEDGDALEEQNASPVAPPRSFLDSSFLEAAFQSLDTQGCMVINIIGDEQQFHTACEAVVDAGFFHTSVDVPGAVGNRQRILFCVRKGNEAMLKYHRIKAFLIEDDRIIGSDLCNWMKTWGAPNGLR